jgi:tol-pal system protein YbgF
MTAARAFAATVLLAAATAVAAAEPTPLPATLALDSLSARLDRLEEQSRSQGLIGLLNQVEALRAEVARLRGSLDELNHRQEQADRRQKEVLADFDQRIKAAHALASRPLPAALPAPVAAAAVAPATAAAAVPPVAAAEDPEAETQAYEAALNLFKAADYAGAVNAFNGFIASYPASALAGNACYWLGLTYFAMGDHKSAVITQRRLLRDYPQHAKVPDALLNMARAHIQLGETEAARQELEQVIAQYPNSKPAELATKILALFK